VVAVRVLELLDQQGVSVPPQAVVAALARPSWPGRLDLRRLTDGREVLFDAAHNPAGAATLSSYLREWGPERRPLVFAGMRDKDVEGMLRELMPVVGLLVMTRASNRRSSDPEELVQLARRIAPDADVTTAASPIEALEIAWRASPRIIVAGSIFLLGDVMKAARELMIPFENGI
jgi:dihydrofolate synthase/folylpolyglutamate synthase